MNCLRWLSAMVLCAVASLMLPGVSTAQYMFLDSNGDGASTTSDSLRAAGITTVDVWLRTDHNRDGSVVTCGVAQAVMSVNSYEFTLRASGGTVKWVSYANLMSGMTVSFGNANDSTDYYVGYGGSSQLAAGTYKLGTLQLQVNSGRPSLGIVPGTPLNPVFRTAFGSSCSGSGGDNSQMLGIDWVDTDGLRASAFDTVLLDSFEDGVIDNFESSTLPGYWTVNDDDPQAGFDSWRPRAWPCLDPYAGTYSASASGDGSQPCGQYDTHQDSGLETNTINMNKYTSYFTSCWANYNLGTGVTAELWRYDFSTQGWALELSFTGSSGGWTNIAMPLITNTNHENDLFAFEYVLYTDSHPAANGWFYIDDVRVHGQPRTMPNLAPYTPSGWSGPIVPSYRPGTNLVETLTAGQTSYIDWAIKNIGTAVAKSFYINYYIDNNLTATDFVDSLLPAAEHKLIDLNRTVSTSGNHTLKIEVDPTPSRVTESDESDNAYSATFYWNPPASPNLFVPGPITVDNANPSLGDSVTVSVTVRNSGNASTGTQFAVGLYKSRASNPSTSDPPDVTKPVGPLGPGGEATVTFKVSSGLVADWTTYVLLDSNGSIGESSESDNAAGPLLIKWRGGVFTVRGRFAYTDSLHGYADTYTQCAVVEVWHADNDGTDSLLATGVLGADGSYQIGPITNLDATPPPGGNAILDVYVRWKFEADEQCWNPGYANQPVVVMKVGDLENVWHYDTPVKTDIPNATWDFGLCMPTDYSHRSAAHVFDVIRIAWIYFGHTYRSQYGSPGPVTVRWVDGYTFGTYYDPPSATIYINGRYDKSTLKPDEWDRFTIAHEYGHHLLWHLGGFSEPADSVTSPNYGTLLSKSLRSAWDEGWADLIGGAIGLQSWLCDDYGRDPDGTVQHVRYDLERGDASFYDNAGNLTQWVDLNEAGPKQQFAIAATLWDLQDIDNDNPNGDAFGDSLWAGWGTVLEEALRYGRGQIETVCDFENWYRTTWCCDPTRPDFVLKAQEVFHEHGIFCGANGPVGVEPVAMVPTSLELFQNNPNPFNPWTVFRLAVPTGTVTRHVTLRIYDVQGKLVRELLDRDLTGGVYEIPWDGASQSGKAGTGVYWCRLDSGGQHRVVRATLLR